MDASEQLNVKTIVTDADGDKVTFSLVNAPSWVTIFSEVDGFRLFGQPDRIASTYDFEVVANDGIAESSLSVQISVSYVLAIDEAENIITIFPNPTSNELKIDAKKVISSIFILDQSGKEVLKVSEGERKINVSSLPAGVYMLLINDSQYFKFIKR
jgi:hypothetical protein